MVVLKLGSYGPEVKLLQQYLNKYNFNLLTDGVFGNKTLDIVKKFQSDNNLVPDGIVGFNTWDKVLFNYRSNSDSKLTQDDFDKTAFILSCESACIKAVKEVETGGNSGFITLGSPTILFEGHIFWNELKKIGINPYTVVTGNEDILYPKWTKKYYLGGIEEYSRLNKARDINNTAANSSASWGMFQIMGNNYKLCGCSSVEEFVSLNSTNEIQQLRLFIRFIYNSKLGKYLKNKQWSEFARRYNGPGYKQNNYDVKLAKAYNKYK